MTTRTVRSPRWPQPASPGSRGRRLSVARLVPRVPLPLAVLLGVAALLTVAWSFTLPAFQGPDESAHFNYAQHLAETGHRPTVTKLAGGPDSKETFTALYTFNLDQLDG